MATYDLTTLPSIVVQNTNLVSRRVELRYHVDFSLINSGSGLAATESALVAYIPAGFVYEDLIPILRTAEGVAATLDIGISTDVDGFLDGGNMNGTANATVAKAGTETIARGTYFHAATGLEVLTPAAAATLDGAVLDIVLVGFLTPTS